MLHSNLRDEELLSVRWLSRILDTLRKECPWDRAQTSDSLRYLTLEECYELSDAILKADAGEQCKELGDIFMHTMFYAKIAEAEQKFTLCDVVDGICRKLIARHPHIALPDRDGNLMAARGEASPGWEQVKMREGRKSVLEGVPNGTPPLLKALRMQEKAAGMGYEFPDEASAFDKVREEYSELRAALAERDASQAAQPVSESAQADEAQRNVEEEFGDLLFALVKWGRFIGVNADSALSRANMKFQHRFGFMEQQATQQGKRLDQLSLAEMNALWQAAKREEH